MCCLVEVGSEQCISPQYSLEWAAADQPKQAAHSILGRNFRQMKLELFEPFRTSDFGQSPRRRATDELNMRVPIVKFSLLFNIIQTETLQGSSVLVLVAFDVDALAGARLLKVRPSVPLRD